MLGFKSFWSAAITIAGIELMHMIRKGQLEGGGPSRPAQQFYSLAISKMIATDFSRLFLNFVTEPLICLAGGAGHALKAIEDSSALVIICFRSRSRSSRLNPSI